MATDSTYGPNLMASHQGVKGSRPAPSPQLTQNELERLESAIHDPHFRQLLCDYAKEVQDPKSRAKYEADIVALEAERGLKCTFLHPNPGYVIKTVKNCSGGGADERVYINVCADETVSEPVSKPVDDAEKKGVCWSIPYFQSQPHSEREKSGDCTAYDVIFHPKALYMAESKVQFKGLLNQTSLDAVERAFDVSLDRQNLKFPKLKFKGSFRPTVIREPQDPTKPASKPTPHYVIKYKDTKTDIPTSITSLAVTDPCRPSHLVIDISLPGLTSAKGVDLDVLEQQLTLDCNHPKPYHLDFKLPYPVYEEDGTAKFDKSTCALVVTLPVKPTPKVSPPERLISTDSGIGLENEEIATPEPDELSNPVVKYSGSDGKSGILPAYNCNIYEDYIVFLLDVKNVDPDSLVKEPLSTEDGFGFALKFSNIGTGMVTLEYSFQVVLLCKQSMGDFFDHLEIDVWDNNVVVQFATDLDCKSYKVGATSEKMSEHAIPQLKAMRKMRDQLKNKDSKGLRNVTNIDGRELAPKIKADDDCKIEDSADEEKERHSSGDSYDSAVSVSLAQAAETSSSPRGILKRCVRRCFSESQAEVMKKFSDTEEETGKKTVRFNEVVKRQVFRQHASILGQKNKNLKKAEQKIRKQRRNSEKLERRVSEGDAIGMMAADGFKLSASFESSLGGSFPPADDDDDEVDDSHPYEDGHDSGLASSYGDHQHRDHAKLKAQKGGKSKRKNNKKKNQTIGGSEREMMFALDD